MDFLNSTPSSVGNEFSLKSFSINARLDEMKSQMLEDKFILGSLVLLGQMTAIYSQPNAGKTLLIIKLLIDAIKCGALVADDVFYFNADDNHRGLVTKTELAVHYGFNMVAPNYNGFRCESVPLYLDKLAEKDACHGQVVILDTVKKFTDLMNKRANSEFNKSLRSFVSKGGTVVGLAHVNKHKNSDGKSVAAGTSDMKDDFDCVYVAECIGQDHNGYKVVTFENTKNRGDNVTSVSYRYRRSNGMTYNDILDSVEMVSDDEVAAASRESRIIESLHANAEIVASIESCLYDNIKLKTEIINTVSENVACPKRKVKQVLELHTGHEYGIGHRWYQLKGNKSALEYRLLIRFDELTTGAA